LSWGGEGRSWSEVGIKQLRTVVRRTMQGSTVERNLLECLPVRRTYSYDPEPTGTYSVQGLNNEPLAGYVRLHSKLYDV
jgi:hypothetical protein